VFDGNSVFITAHRDGFADGKYPCVSKAKGCFNFGPNSQGVPTAIDPTVANEFDNLCPTEDVNSSDAPGSGLWTFTYTIWSQPNCTGTVITGENFNCFAESDLATQNNANETANENLPPGQVVNTVICTSENTEKSFDFNVCQELPNAPDKCLFLDCACTSSGTDAGADAGSVACTCPWFAKQGVNEPPPGCRFDAACNVVCCPITCPCDSLQLWQKALSGTPLSCSDTQAGNIANWAVVNVDFGVISAGTGLPGQPGSICQVSSVATGQNDILHITQAQANVCLAELREWELSHALVCQP
jgi:hypothetical protein